MSLNLEMKYTHPALKKLTGETHTNLEKFRVATQEEAVA